MDLAAAQNLLAGSIAQQTGQDGRWQWGRWDGNSVYLDDAPDVPLVADNAAGDLLPGSRVYCQLVGRRVIIHGPVKPIPESHSGGSSDGQWYRSPDGVQICWQRIGTTSAATRPYGGLHLLRHLWVFPQRFLLPPAVTVGRLQLGTGAAMIASTEDPEPHQCMVRALDVAERPQGTPLYFTAIAIGRWK